MAGRGGLVPLPSLCRGWKVQEVATEQDLLLLAVGAVRGRGGGGGGGGAGLQGWAAFVFLRAASGVCCAGSSQWCGRPSPSPSGAQDAHPWEPPMSAAASLSPSLDP